MDKLAQSQTASTLSIIAGAWLAISPIWISITGGALVSLFIVAGIMVVFGLAQLFTGNNVPSWIIGISAIYLFIAAFAFTVGSSAAWNEAILAIIAFVLSIWDSVEVTQSHRAHHHVGTGTM